MPPDFATISRQTVAEFMRTVVIVDDRPKLVTAEPPPAVLNPPKKVTPEPEEKPPAKTEDIHDLPLEEVTNSFAGIGVCATVVKPAKENMDDFVDQFVKGNALGMRCDVLILDWVLHQFKQGEKTLEIIARLTAETERQPGQTRLIIVYTAESDLLLICERIRGKLGLPQPADTALAEQAVRIEKGGTTVVVYAKPKAGVAPELRNRIIDTRDLPEIALKEFAQHAAGILSNAVLKALATLRSETFHVLRRFNHDLDPAFITHKVLLNPEEDAASHILPLIVSEIQAILEDHQLPDLLNDEILVSWLDRQIANGLKLNIPDTTEVEARDGVVQLIETATNSPAFFTDQGQVQAKTKFSSQFLKSKSKAASQVRDNLTGILGGKRGTGGADQQLAILMSIRSRYGSPPPRLSLGTVIQEENTNDFMVCVQPRCDSVRLNESRDFLFLPLEASEDQFSFLIQSGDRILKLKVNDRPYKLVTLPFSPQNAGDHEILAKQSNGKLLYRSDSDNRQFRWIAELRADHGQRIANELASKISRVGLTESEWLRLATKGRS